MQANLVASLLAVLIVNASPPAPAKIHPIAAVQLRTTYAVDWEVRVNGFDLDPLPSMAGEANNDGEPIRGFTSSGGMLEYTVVHPYFLKSGDNSVAVKAWRKPNYDDDKGAKTFAARVVSIDWDPANADQYSMEWPTKELAKIEVPPMQLVDKTPKEAKATVKWSSVPSWSWTKGTKIANDAKTKESLYAAAQKLWQQLAAQPAATPADRAAFRDALKAQSKEYAQACEIDGPKVHFVDDLAVIAATNDFPGAPSREKRKKAALEDQKKGPPRDIGHVDDAPSPVDPAVYDKVHLSLEKLHPIGEYKMDVFGDGALAKLKAENDDSLITYFSNYPDGQWGRTGEELVKADIWFRKNAKGEWEVDAVVDAHMARLGMRDDPLNDLLEVQYPK